MKKGALILVAILWGVAGSAGAQVWQEGKTLRIAHRGARALVDENTLEALMKAIEIGVDTVEFDLQRTRDGVYVLMHDPTVDRTTQGKGLVADMTLSELKQVKTKNGYAIPTLEEVLQALKPTKVGIILDIKVNDPDCIPELYALAEKYGLVERTVFETTSAKVAKKIEQFNPKLVSAIYPAWPPSAYYYAKKYQIDCVSLYYPFASSWEIKRSQKAGFKVVVWTVNKPELISRFRDKFQVDGIMSDDPGLFKEAQDNSCGCSK